MANKRMVKRSEEAEIINIITAFEDFILEKQAKNLAPKTIHNYQQSFNLFCKFYSFDENTDISDIKLQHIFKWINQMKLEAIKPTSINHYLRDIRAFLYWAMDNDRAYLPYFKIEMQVHQEESLKMFTDAEIDILLNKPRRNDSFSNFRMWVIVNWVLGTGNRASTITDLTIGDINFNKKEITLRHTKNRKLQIIPLSTSLSVILKDYIKLWRKDEPAEAWLFPSIGNEKLTTNALRLAFTRYCEERGVNRHNIHGLRHNFAKAWVRANGNMYQLQTMLGHSSLDMTRKYVRLFAEDIKEDFDKFSPLDQIKRNQKRTQTVKRYD